VIVSAAGREVEISSPDKEFFSTRGETKLDLVRYYLSMADPIMRQMGDRPVMMQRFPNGAGGSSFFQKRIPDSAPEWLHSTLVHTMYGTESRALVIGDIADLVWAVNLGCLGFHVWAFRVGHEQVCDQLRIDLDPGEGTTYAMAQEAAHETRRLLDDLGVRGWIKTSGNRGLHVYVPLSSSGTTGRGPIDVRRAAVAVARELERRRPDLVTASWWKEERGPRIFIDFNQNAPHKTVFGAWSVRALPHAPVSFPFPWELLDTLQPHSMTIATVPAWVTEHGDAWADMTAQPLEPFLLLADDDERRGLPDAPWPPNYPKSATEPSRVTPSRKKRD
jgi:DNA ligase D